MSSLPSQKETPTSLKSSIRQGASNKKYSIPFKIKHVKKYMEISDQISQRRYAESISDDDCGINGVPEGVRG